MWQLHQTRHASLQTEGVEIPPHTNLYVEVLATPRMRGMQWRRLKGPTPNHHNLLTTTQFTQLRNSISPSELNCGTLELNCQELN
jgi:hypothetical protein